MKHLLKRYLLFIPILLTGFLLVSCEEEEEVYKEDCEINHTGDVYVKNNTGTSIKVDVTSGNESPGYGRVIYDGETTVFYNVSSGSITVWARWNESGANWKESHQTLNSCMEMDFSWSSEY